MRPLVLIVGRNLEETKGVRGEPFGAGRRYFHAIDRAGGVPIMLPPMPSLVDDIGRLMGRVDAVVLHGGGDIDPRRYGQEATTEQLMALIEPVMIMVLGGIVGGMIVALYLPMFKIFEVINQ